MLKKKLFEKSDKDKNKKEKIADTITILFGIIAIWGSLLLIILSYNPYDIIYAYLKDFFSMDLWLISFLIVFDIWIFIVWVSNNLTKAIITDRKRKAQHKRSK